jgi:hypothetical protein
MRKEQLTHDLKEYHGAHIVSDHNSYDYQPDQLFHTGLDQAQKVIAQALKSILKCTPGEPYTGVEFINGPPGVGKTRFTHLSRSLFNLQVDSQIGLIPHHLMWDEFEEVTLLMRGQNLDPVTGKPTRENPNTPEGQLYHLLRLTVESGKLFGRHPLLPDHQAYLNRLKQIMADLEGGLMFDPHRTHPETFMRDVSDIYNFYLAHLIDEGHRSNRHQLIYVDSVGHTGVRFISPKTGRLETYISRHYNPHVLEIFNQRLPPFHFLAGKQIDLHSLAITNLATQYTGLYRSLLKLSPSLDFANMVNRVFGYQEPLTKTEWRHRRAGGSFASVIDGPRHQANTAKFLHHHNNLHTMPWVINALISPQIKRGYQLSAEELARWQIDTLTSLQPEGATANNRYIQTLAAARPLAGLAIAKVNQTHAELNLLQSFLCVNFPHTLINAIARNPSLYHNLSVWVAQIQSTEQAKEFLPKIINHLEIIDKRFRHDT